MLWAFQNQHEGVSHDLFHYESRLICRQWTQLYPYPSSPCTPSSCDSWIKMVHPWVQMMSRKIRTDHNESQMMSWVYFVVGSYWMCSDLVLSLWVQGLPSIDQTNHHFLQRVFILYGYFIQGTVTTYMCMVPSLINGCSKRWGDWSNRALIYNHLGMLLHLS